MCFFMLKRENRRSQSETFTVQRIRPPPGVALTQGRDEWRLPVCTTPRNISRKLHQRRGKGDSARWPTFSSLRFSHVRTEVRLALWSVPAWVCTALSLHLPPVSVARTSLHRPEKASSGNAAFLSWRACNRIAPPCSVGGPRRRS